MFRRPSAFTILGLITWVTLSSCGSVHQVYEPEGPFEGIGSRLERARASDGKLRLVVVHGMGKHAWGFSDYMMECLLDRLGFPLAKGLTEQPHTLAGTSATERVIHHSDAEGRERLVIQELAWGPIVADVKAQQLDFDREPPFCNYRECLNARIKNEMIADRLADPVIYFGRYGAAIRAATREVLRDALASDPRDEVCFVTHSMGGVVVFDTLTEMAMNGEVPGGRRILHYMLANQLALLELGKSDASHTLAGTPGFPSTGSDGDTRVDAVLFSDPNDMLTFGVPETFKRAHARYRNLHYTYTNVAVTVADTSYFGLLASPLEAHAGYARCNRVLDALVGGHAPQPSATEESAAGAAVP